MFCTQCGTQNLDDSQFCVACGQDLSRSRPPEASRPSATQPAKRVSLAPAAAPEVEDVGELPTQLETPGLGGGRLIDDRLQILEKLGEGGMGTVWKARDVRLGRLVALKRPRPELLNAEGRARFMREAQASARLCHPNIITIYNVGEDEEGPYIEMEYVAGSSLRDEVRRAHGGLEEQWVRELGGQLCNALALAHSHGIIHRDIKPANILLNQQGTAKLGDFGLAAPGEDMASMTASGAVMGTVFYASPEQLRGARGLDARSDIYSLAATLYFALTGEDPRVIRIEKVPAALRAVLQKALEEDPAARWPDMNAFAQALKGPAPPPEKVQSVSPVEALTRQISSLTQMRAFRKVQQALEKIKAMGGASPDLEHLQHACGQALARAGELLGEAKQAVAAGDWKRALTLASQGQESCSDDPELDALARQAKAELRKRRLRKLRPVFIIVAIIMVIAAAIQQQHAKRSNSIFDGSNPYPDHNNNPWTPKPPPTPAATQLSREELNSRVSTLYANFRNAVSMRFSMLPPNVQYLINQGITFSNAGNYSGALMLFNQAVMATGQQDPISIFQAGWANLGLGNYEAFQAAMESVKRLDGDGSLTPLINEALTLAPSIMHLQRSSQQPPNLDFESLFR